MPSKNHIRQFEPESVYHVYNRGVNKCDIFLDQRDYAVFLSFLKYALLSDSEQQRTADLDISALSEAQRFNLRRLGLAGKVELLSFCLMPNHFHLLLYQHSPDGVTKIMRSIATGFSIYFNKRHKRVGALFQGKYKASKINSEAYWQHISRYIHLNPLDLMEDYKLYPYSSFRYYTRTHNAEWINTKLITELFFSIKNYEKFHDDYIPHRNELLGIKNMLANSQELTVQGRSLYSK